MVARVFWVFARRLLGCSGVVTRVYWVVARVFWVVARVYWVVARVFWVVASGC